MTRQDKNESQEGNFPDSKPTKAYPRRSEPFQQLKMIIQRLSHGLPLYRYKLRRQGKDTKSRQDKNKTTETRLAMQVTI